MATVIPIRRPRHKGTGDGGQEDTYEILTLVPARPGWTVHVLAYDDITTEGEMLPTSWTTPVAAWGHVAWHWSHQPTAPPERYWEALVADMFGSLSPAWTEGKVSNVVEVIVVGPGQEPPEWAGGTAVAHRKARECIAEYLAETGQDE
jgi:hypothetical protein